MGKQVLCRIDESLEKELKRIQETMKSQLGDVDLSKPQASIIAAKMLRENPSIINAGFILSKRGRRINGINL